jgi:hypothetical protein
VRCAAPHADGHSIKKWQMFGSAYIGATVAILPNYNLANLQTVMQCDEGMPRLVVGRTDYFTAGIGHGRITREAALEVLVRGPTLAKEFTTLAPTEN